MGSLLALLLLLVFAVCVLSVLLTGADTYQALTKRDQDSYDRRTAAQYLATRVRQADQTGGVTAADFQGCDALELTDIIDGELYVTRIYCYDGYLRELFIKEGVAASAGDGREILATDGFSFEESRDGLFHLSCTDSNGNLSDTYVSIKSSR